MRQGPGPCRSAPTLTGSPSINWLQFARDHCVPGQNAGQVVNELAQTPGFDTAMLDGKQVGVQRTRSRKRRLVGGEISAPSTPTPDTFQEEWEKLVEIEQSLSRTWVQDYEICYERWSLDQGRGYHHWEKVSIKRDSKRSCPAGRQTVSIALLERLAAHFQGSPEEELLN